MEKIVEIMDDFNRILEEKQGVLFYFSIPTCNVCKVLKPKVKNMLKEKFEEIEFYYVNVEKAKELAANLSIFTIPTILVFFGGKEFLRKSRYIGIKELENYIKRLYTIFSRG